jgi:hypothetical protein
LGGFTQRECSVELSWGNFEDIVAMCARHREDKIGVGGNPLREPS